MKGGTYERSWVARLSKQRTASSCRYLYFVEYEATKWYNMFLLVHALGSCRQKPRIICVVSFELYCIFWPTSLSWFIRRLLKKQLAPLQFISRAVCDLFIQDLKRKWINVPNAIASSLLTNLHKWHQECERNSTSLDVSQEPSYTCLLCYRKVRYGYVPYFDTVIFPVTLVTCVIYKAPHISDSVLLDSVRRIDVSFIRYISL